MGNGRSINILPKEPIFIEKLSYNSKERRLRNLGQKIANEIQMKNTNDIEYLLGFFSLFKDKPRYLEKLILKQTKKGVLRIDFVDGMGRNLVFHQSIIDHQKWSVIKKLVKEISFKVNILLSIEIDLFGYISIEWNYTRLYLK